MTKVVLVFFVFCVTLNVNAQRGINPESLNTDQLDIYRHKATRLRNAGWIVTCSGVGIVAAGYAATCIWAGNTKAEGYEVFKTLAPFFYGMAVGIPAALAGISLVVAGTIKINKAEIALRKFSLKPANSFAVGIGVTIRF